ncbi:MAG TPA: CocE/NonD family hydrolase [Terriglobales bacterium]|nr:CocE/NonD family hydrolase [Terriglobales bacterium]
MNAGISNARIVEIPNPAIRVALSRLSKLLLVLLLPLLIAQAGFALDPPSPPTYGVRMQDTWIPMKDGVRLAVKLYMPEGAGQNEKFPAVLEYDPYRKDDATAERDYALYSYFVRRGYVCARVDIRGFGNSQGTPTDREYSEQEQTDGVQIISWLAHQPWSNGNVGMMGISWSGFNSLQMAMRHPPELKAIIAVDATAELFHDDVHYIDGMAHVDEFELNMDMAPGMTGAPDFTLDEKILGPRFEAPPWSLLYLKHQHDGPFWRSPVRPYSEIKIPCFLIGGLLDGYRDSVPDMLERTRAPLKAIIGPWNHTFPNDAVPGPQIEWRDQAVRWWDYWLKGRETGVLNDPKLVVYMQHWHPPDPNLENVPGEWRNEDGWPPRDLKPSTLFLQPDHSLADSPSPDDIHQLKYIPSVGVEAGFWWGELLSDPRPVDAFSLVYDSAPLMEEIAILGDPHAVLLASASAPLADWFARLSDVAPDGTVTQITGAGLNGAQRESMAEPRELEPGKMYALDISMHLTSWVFPKGHRIRVAISNALWPMVLPTPYSMTTSLKLGGSNGSRLVLPVVPRKGAAATELHAPAFAPPQPSEQRQDIKSVGYPWPGEWTLERDEANHKATVHWRGKAETNYPWGKESDVEALTYNVDDAHPDVSAVHGEAESIFTLKGRELRWRGHLSVTTDQKNFHYKYVRELLKDGQLVKQKTWQETILRDHQ